jgi:hypothetical protein
VETSFYTAVGHADSALSDANMLKSIWLELRKDNVEELKKKILQFGIKGIETKDRKHFVFLAMGK